MDCPSCHYAIAPGLTIALPDATAELRHCPYCLGVLSGTEAPTVDPTTPDPSNVSVHRFAARRQIRERFLDELRAVAADGRPHCPVCTHPLDKNEELELRTGEQFRCRGCSRDLALEAYQRSAYAEDRWRPVVELLLEQHARSERCAHCRYLGAMGTACVQALSRMPKPLTLHRTLLHNLLAAGPWVIPECDWPSACAAAAQYRSLAGEGLALL